MRSSLASLLLAAAAWLPLAASFATGPPMTRRRPRRSGLAALVACAAADPRHEPLLSWLEKCGSELGPVSLGKSRIGAGYGAFATRDVAEGELLFSVPSSACIGLYDACGDEDVGEQLARLVVKGQGGATVALAGILAKEWLCEGTAGPRGPFLAMLPWDAEWPPEGEQEQEHCLWWSEAQVDALEGSPAYADAVGIRDEVALAAKVIKSLIGASVRRAYQQRGGMPWAVAADVMRADDDIDKAVRGAFVAILTRSFTQEGLDDEETRLVPLLDMLQHAALAESNVRHVQLNAEGADEADGGQRVVVTASRAIAQGEELLNCYDGDKFSPETFLTRFGFVPGGEVGEFIATIKEKDKGRLPFGFRIDDRKNW